ncbi:cupin domain-containing protein [Myxococcota bacterium]|nr:cupin domain-containing protein [Myxococcota bacterium]
MERSFDRVNLSALVRRPVAAHGGEGLIEFCRIVESGGLAGGVNFIDSAVLPPGTSIGRHRHAAEEEELYLILSGEGLMWRDGEEFEVRTGDLVRNRPGGAHGLRNTGAGPLSIFVIELRVSQNAP